MSYFCSMTIKQTLEARVSYRIKRSKDSVFIRKDFEDIGGYDQVGRVLRNLVKKNIITKLGYGAYAKVRKLKHRKITYIIILCKYH